jgi:chromosome segregation ATPase
MTPVSELDELAAALASAERELRELRETIRREQEARVGSQLQPLLDELARTEAEAADAEAANAKVEARVEDLAERAEALEQEIAQLEAGTS